ncbi:MAG: hypothetical protein ACYC2G_10005, partial [Gemmatimonadaceae bacterium]
LVWGLVAAAAPATGPVPEPVVVPPKSALSLEELLGRPVSAGDELAAGALAAATLALQGDAEVDAALAEASEEDPLALENVLTPPAPATLAALRGGASFSFEQFFRAESPAAEPGGDAGSGPAAPPPAASEAAAGSANPSTTGSGEGTAPAAGADDEAAAREADLADFHAWLAGLSKS